MKDHTKLCHGDYNPSNVIINENGEYYVIDWSHATQGNASADAARTFLLLSMGGETELAEKYLRQGTKIVVSGRIQTGSYTNRDGQKVYTTEVVVEESEFAESKANSGASSEQSYQASPAPSPRADIGDGFMNIPDGIDEELPFS